MAKKSSDGTKVTRISASNAKVKKPAKKHTLVAETEVLETEVVEYDQSDKIQGDPTENQREKRRFFGRSKKETRAEKHELATEKQSRNPFKAFGRYLKGSWTELREVRWPTRRATWGMTGALLGFTAFFVVLVLLLDAGFQWLFNLLLGV